MLTFRQKEVKNLIRNILMGKSVPELTLIIKDDDITGARTNDDSQVDSFAGFGRRKKRSDNVDTAVRFPARRILNPVSRSARDIWTIAYMDRTIAEGRFDEMSRMLSDMPRQVVSSPYAMAKQMILWAGLAALLGAFFMIGFRVGGEGENPALASLEAKIGNIKPATPIDYSGRFDKLQTSLEAIIKRQEALHNLIAASFPGARPAQAKGPAQQEEGLRAKFDTLIRDMELRQLISLKQKKEDLVYKDQELASQGFRPPHPQRQSIAASLDAVNKKIAQAKEKYNLFPNE